MHGGKVSALLYWNAAWSAPVESARASVPVSSAEPTPSVLLQSAIPDLHSYDPPDNRSSLSAPVMRPEWLSHEYTPENDILSAVYTKSDTEAPW